MLNLRFGADPSRSAHADTLLARAAKHGSKPVLTLARVARQATPATAAGLRSQLAGAGLSGAFATEAALLDGELALLASDVPGAAASFEKARGLGAGVRADYGLARTAKDADAKAAFTALVAAAPQHPEARTRLAAIQVAEGDRDGALASLAPITPAAASPHAMADALALKGNLLLEDGKSAEARAAFDEAFRLDPSSEAALLGQAESFFQAGRYSEALARFEGAAKLPKAATAATVGVARTKLKLEAAADADAILTAAKKAAPDDPQIAYWLGEAKRSLGKSDEALALFDAAIKGYSPKSPEAFLPYAASAKILSQRGDEAKALATLDAAKKALPASVALDRAFGDLAAAGGRYDAAITHYRSAAERDPKDWSVHLALAGLLRKSGKLDEASKELDLIAAADKDFPGLTLERGVLLEQSGKLDEALGQFKNALAAAPDDLDRVLRVGAAYLAVGSIDDAMPLLERVQKARPDSAEAQHYLGRAKLLRGGPFASDALRLLKRASELDPNNAQFHVYVAWAANEGTPPQVQIAREEAERALAIDKQEADAYWQRGVSYLKEGAFVSAQDDLRKAVELKPERSEAHAALAECYEGQSLFSQAVAEWKTAITRNPKPAYWRYRYGRLIAERGAGQEAATHLEYAVTEGTKASVRPGWLTLALFQEAQTFRKVGRNKDALAAYRDYVASAPASAPDRRDAEAAIAALSGNRPPE
jgi:tetratricopeptide (TPR) repeat protein